MDRRRFVGLTATAGLTTSISSRSPFAAEQYVVSDVSGLNAVTVANERRPRSTDEVADILRRGAGRVSVGGGRYSMGGQIALADSLHLDMRALNHIVHFDAQKRVIRAQAGATWRDIQDVIDPLDLSVKIMQSYSNFTVGGSVSVNCHGRYVGRGPLVNSVRAVQLVTAGGEVLELTRSQHVELFAGVFGGYGGLGLITEVELDLETNSRMERVVEAVPLEDYPAFFRDRILADPRMLMHNADLTPPAFDSPRSISWRTTNKSLTVPDRLVPRGLDYDLEQNAIWAITELPGGKHLRHKVTQGRYEQEAVVLRNREASLDTASLEPRTRAMSTYLLQEYFIPVEHFVQFARDMAAILTANDVNALNVSLRHSPEDHESVLTWAPTEVFCFVLYFKQRSTNKASAQTQRWTRQLIDKALEHGGRYYLPYRLDATPEQFAQAYPEVKAFAALKAKIDPAARFSNMLWAKYLPEA